MPRRRQPDLPVIESCDGCGACCREQQSPPGYVALLVDPTLAAGPFQDDADRLKTLPDAAMQSLQDYIAARRAGSIPDRQLACIWLTRHGTCRFYDHRPLICRESLQPGDDGCRSWRRQFQIKPY
jgi:Fe-S-cluster containining protein